MRIRKSDGKVGLHLRSQDMPDFNRQVKLLQIPHPGNPDVMYTPIERKLLELIKQKNVMGVLTSMTDARTVVGIKVKDVVNSLKIARS